MEAQKTFPKLYTGLIDKLEGKTHIIGYVYFVIANLCYAFLNMNVRRASSVPHFQLFYFRSIFPTLMFYLVNKVRGQVPFSHSWKINKLLICNGIMYLIGGSCIFYGFQVVPLGEATVLFQTNPAIAGILSTLILSEAYDVIQFSITVLCTLGVILISKPAFIFSSLGEDVPEDPEKGKGIISLLVGAFMIGLQSVVIKKVVSHIDSNLSAFYIGLIPSLLGSVLMLTEGAKLMNADELIIIAEIAVLGFLAQVFYNRAFKFGDAGKITIMAYSQIIFGFLLDIYILGSTPDFYSVVGATFIFCCMFLRIYKTTRDKDVLE